MPVLFNTTKTISRVRIPLSPPKVIPSIDKKYFVIRWFYFALKRLETSDSKIFWGSIVSVFWDLLFMFLSFAKS